MLPQDYDGIFKVIIVGNSGVGKYKYDIINRKIQHIELIF